MTVSYAEWQSYPWKNELKLQLERVLIHCQEIMDEDVAGDQNPHDMLERALVLAAFSVRRLIEKRLVTDAFAARKFRVGTFAATVTSGFRHPFPGQSGGDFFLNYDHRNPVFEDMAPKWIADEIIHSSQLMVIQGEAGIMNGLLVVSDLRLKKRILHFPLKEFENYVNAVLADFVRSASDWRNDDGTVTATRG